MFKIEEYTNGKGVDVVIIAASAENIINQASQIARKRGEVSMVAMITEEVSVYPYSFVFNELTLFGSMTYETKDFVQAIQLINDGLDLSDFIKFWDTQKALNLLSEKTENVVKIIVEV